MGGHGALVCALRNPVQYRSVSAFAPIVAPSQVPWGHKAFSNYLGANRGDWLAYDSTQLVQQSPRSDTILVDQGLGDKFLAEQLRPELFEDACQRSGQKLQLRRHAEYDHGYYFMQTFMPDHIAFHAASLRHA
jgi:S-formylglutathione hydrolase